jgi:hypothetical protein
MGHTKKIFKKRISWQINLLPISNTSGAQPSAHGHIFARQDFSKYPFGTKLIG